VLILGLMAAVGSAARLVGLLAVFVPLSVARYRRMT